MAEIRPFVSIRPQRGKAAEIAALPYDVYNREEATKEVELASAVFLMHRPRGDTVPAVGGYVRRQGV